jgi:hypothetical protein
MATIVAPVFSRSQFETRPGMSRSCTSPRRQYFRRFSGVVKLSRQTGGKPFPFLALDDVNGRDKPGHDGAD